MQVQSLGWEDPLEEDMATLSSILSWKIPRTEEPGVGYSPWGHKKSDTTEREYTHTHTLFSRNQHMRHMFKLLTSKNSFANWEPFCL